MKTKNWFKNKLDELKDDFEFRLEGFILNITEDICKRMKKKNINRTDLAQKLNVSRPAVTKILNGSSNFTLRTLLSIADALEFDLEIGFTEKNLSFYTTFCAEEQTNIETETSTTLWEESQKVNHKEKFINAASQFVEYRDAA
jgi:transcriptional regulator with XRE-family HTH domain